MSADLLGLVVRGLLGGRRKRSRNALRFLTGTNRHAFLNASTLMTAAGVAWGIFETVQGRESGPATSAPVDTPPPPPGSPSSSAAAPDDALRMIRLAVSAANADGAMSEQERAAIAREAQAAGASDLVARELERRIPLSEIVTGVSDPNQRATLYVLAFTILRADEQISGLERIYLAQLANLLGLDPQLVQSLEENTGERIDALGDQGQLGG